MPSSAARGFTLAAAAVALAVTAAGCASASSGTHHAGVASQFGTFSTTPMPSVTVSAQAVSPTGLTSASPAIPTSIASPPVTASVPATGSAGPGDFTSPTPCPLPAPQQFVEGKSAVAKGDSIVFSYVDAEKLCGGPDDGQYVAKTSVVTSATVDPAAVVLVLPPDGSTQPRQIPAAALPAAMKANNQAPFYAITYAPGAGPIVRIEQYFHP
ncbi:MAG: hypothetical protein ACRDV3_04280 [Acidothermaceae bacterium]